MTPKEIVLQAVTHHETDVIPYMLSVEAETRERVDEHYGGRENFPEHDRFFAGQGCPWRSEDLPDGGFRDIFGVKWEQGTTFQITEPALKEPDLSGFEFPELIKDEDVPAIAEKFEESKEYFRRYNFGMLYFERAWALRGMEELLMDMASEPAFTTELFERLAQLHLDAFDKILHLDFEEVRFGDDFGSQKGLIMGLRCWRKYIKPGLEKMYRSVREAGKFVSIHSCGDNSEILGEMIDMGLQIFNPAQPEANDLPALKKEYGKHLTFEGGIGTQVTLPFGTPDEVREEVRQARAQLGPGGGFIMTTTKPLRPEVPVENAVAAVETIIEEAHKGSPR